MSNDLPSLVSLLPVPIFIDGKPTTTATTFPVADPHGRGVLHEVHGAQVPDAIKAVEAAQRALPAWRATSMMDRRAIFSKAVDIMRRRADELCKLEVRETTSGTGWVGVDIGVGTEVIEELAAVATSFRGEIAPAPAGQLAYVTRVPYGVVFAMAPWNAPMILGLRAVACPIMAGNTCVFKTSEFCPRLHLVIADIFREAGLPAGVLNVIHVATKDAPAVAEAVIAHPAVRKVNFTGSTRVGRIIATICAQNLKSSCMELGGCCPLLVLDDADLDATTNSILFGGFLNSGQVCMSTNTVIVHESIADALGKRLKAHFEQKSTDGQTSKMTAWADSPSLRGLFTTASAQRLHEWVGEALKEGAEILTGSHHCEGNVIQPVILHKVTKNMKIFEEEAFGPLVIIMTFKTDAEAVDLANGTAYGLTSSIYSKNIARASGLAAQIDTGLVHINGSTIHDAQQLPHGGMKNSGWGRFNGLEGLREFSQTKTMTVTEEPHPYPV